MKTIIKISSIILLLFAFTQVQAQSSCCAKKTQTESCCKKEGKSCCKKEAKSCKKEAKCSAGDSTKCAKDKSCCKKGKCSTKNSQTSVKETSASFMVAGVCGMCKTRIEKAALIVGVKSAQWDKATQSLSVVYNGKKVSELDIHTAIAAVGHKTSKVEPNMDAYNSLPGCCKYLDNAQTH